MQHDRMVPCNAIHPILFQPFGFVILVMAAYLGPGFFECLLPCGLAAVQTDDGEADFVGERPGNAADLQ